MAIKKVYLARHGQSVSNSKEIIQAEDDPLSEVGEVQAGRLAERAAQLPFKHLLTSDMTRAKQTAGFVSRLTGQTVVEVSTLREVSNPSRFLGLSQSDAEFRSHISRRLESFKSGDDKWSEYDEESFGQIQSRALASLDSFLKYEGDIFAVSHGHFLRFLVSMVLTKSTLTPELWFQLGNSYFSENTGLTVIEYLEDESRWRLKTFNDLAHFAD